MLRNCKFFTAKTAGFCFGVDRAVKIVYNMLDSRNKVVTLGPIIHNKNVVGDLEQKGVYAISGTNEATSDMTVVIRSHGVGQNVYDELSEIGADVVDATCPFVSRIHKIAKDRSQQGDVIFIAGDKTHPEVVGISGHCVSEPFVFSDETELERIIVDNGLSDKAVAVISQTTFNTQIWQRCIETLADKLPNARVFDTICNATSERQREAQLLAKDSDIMIIVGGKHSSNTHKLAAVCEKYCPTHLIETADELHGIDFGSAEKIGISAGASTPAYIIKEVQQTMSEIMNTMEEFNLEAIDQSFQKIYTGKKVTGIITSVNNSEAMVDIGTKHTGIIPSSELSYDSSAKASDIVKKGDEVELIVLKISDKDGIVTLSKKQVDAVKGLEAVEKALEDGTVLKGTVTNVVKGGVILNANGVRVFVPASQATARRDDKLEELLKKEVEFKVLEVVAAKQRVVGSIRAVAKEARAAARTKFFETAQAGETVKGTVKSITDYGVFVDLGGIDGLIRKPDLSWNRIKHPSDVVAVGDEIEVIIKEIDAENGKIALTYKKDNENPWNIFVENYAVDQVIDATIVSITSFGAFAQIINGVDGLIHISQIANTRVGNVAELLEVGQKVQVKITEIDTEKNRISLSMRALLPEEEAEEAAEEAPVAEEE